MKDIYIVDVKRTPFLKSLNIPGPFSASDLAVFATQQLLSESQLSVNHIDELILGCVMPSENEANIARIVSLRSGFDKSVPAYTVQRNCSSGMQAIDSAYKDILLGRAEIVVCGGAEAMSRAPLLYKPEMAIWLAKMYQSKTILAKLRQLTKLRPSYFKPIIALLCGLSDPLLKLSMGQTAENIAYHFGISREEMDAFAVESHRRVAEASKNGYLDILSIFDNKGKMYNQDTGLRQETTLERLAKLKPIFDRKYGRVTAGNSSQVTDGASMLLLASEDAVNAHNLSPIAKIKAVKWAGCDPAEMGLGPAYAIPRLLSDQGLSISDIDYWEINEAFATQVIGCVKALEDEQFCQSELGLKSAFGSIDYERLNVDGGAIALGHPVGASGARIVAQLTKILERNQAKFGVATICIGGGQGGAMLIENIRR